MVKISPGFKKFLWHIKNTVLVMFEYHCGTIVLNFFLSNIILSLNLQEKINMKYFNNFSYITNPYKNLFYLRSSASTTALPDPSTRKGNVPHIARQTRIKRNRSSRLPKTNRKIRSMEQQIRRSRLSHTTGKSSANFTRTWCALGPTELPLFLKRTGK